MAFESALKALEKSEKKIKTTLTNEEKFVLIQKIKKFGKYRPQLQEFKSVYQEFELKADAAYVVKRERQFLEEGLEHEDEARFYGQVLELLVVELGNFWLPGDISRSSNFDDYKNAVDAFWEVEDQNGEAVRAGLDVTSDERKIKDKLNEALDEYAAGKFHEVKYFYSKSDQTRGRLTVPRLIAVADRDEVIELARLYVSEKNAASKERKDNLKDRIAQHGFGSKLVAEVLQQIEGAITLILANAYKYPPEAAGEKIYHLERLRNSLQELRKNKKTPSKVAGAGEVSEGRTHGTLGQALLAGIQSRSR